MGTQSAITAEKLTATLPDAVMLRGTCEVEVTELNLVLRYAGRQLTRAGPTTVAGYALAPLAQGRVLLTNDLPPHARRLLTTLASRGILVDPDLPEANDASSDASGRAVRQASLQCSGSVAVIRWGRQTWVVVWHLEHHVRNQRSLAFQYSATNPAGPERSPPQAGHH